MSLPTPDLAVKGFPPDPLPPILLGGSVNLLAGAPNVGKTAFLSRFLVRLRDGLPIFGVQTQPVPSIGIVSVDRSWHQSSQLWFQLAGWPGIPHYCLQDDDDFVVDRLASRHLRMAILQESLDKLATKPWGLAWGSLICVDPIAPFLGGNLLDYDTCMVACTRIRRICRQRGITILGLSHAGKQRNDPRQQYVRLQDRIIGSAAQFGYTDTQMYLASPEETGESTYTFLWNPHHAPCQTFPLTREVNGLFVPVPEQSPRQQATEAPVTLDTGSLRAIYGLLTESSNGSATADLLTMAQAQHQLSRATTFRSLNQLAGAGFIESAGRGRWRRKESGPSGAVTEPAVPAAPPD